MTHREAITWPCRFRAGMVNEIVSKTDTSLHCPAFPIHQNTHLVVLTGQRSRLKFAGNDINSTAEKGPQLNGMSGKLPWGRAANFTILIMFSYKYPHFRRIHGQEHNFPHTLQAHSLFFLIIPWCAYAEDHNILGYSIHVVDHYTT